MNLRTVLTEFEASYNWLPGSLSYLLSQSWCTESNLKEELRRNILRISNCPNDNTLGARTLNEHKFLIALGTPEDLV